MNICVDFKFGIKFIHVMTICYVDHQNVFQSKKAEIFRMGIFSEILKTGCRTQGHV